MIHLYNAAIHDDPTPFEHPLAPWPSGPARTTCCRSAGAGIPPGRWRGPWGPGAFHGSRPTTSSLLAIRPANCIKMHQKHRNLTDVKFPNILATTASIKACVLRGLKRAICMLHCDFVPSRKNLEKPNLNSRGPP